MKWVKQLSELANFQKHDSYTLRKLPFCFGIRISSIVPNSLKNDKAELKLR